MKTTVFLKATSGETSELFHTESITSIQMFLFE